MILLSLVVQACFLWIVVSMVMVIAQSYLIIGMGQLLLCFGGLRYVQDILMNLVRSVIAIGAKLYSLQLIASIGTAMLRGWLDQSMANKIGLHEILVLIGETVVLAAITTSIPHTIEQLILSPVTTGGASNIAGAVAEIAAS
jgi:type IV secretion system protein TrbL